MATTRSATTTWHGSLLEGSGRVELKSSGLGGFDVTLASGPRTRRSHESRGAHRGGALLVLLHGAVECPGQGGGPPETLGTTAEVTFQPGEGITGIHLTVRGQVPGITADDFTKAAEGAKTGCPVSQALKGTTITLDATLA